ncbi:hypothetical protein GPECTOR_56g428 [Gonium pectorale]|uniref:Uncharacterized protein n=1 Tax=Gonium pectorale TaxID=33097 RepID=A0A150G672_GONPE|nr:hypothetical protein GPECTOR_56g428 [Gonium pectorale]|eukprot:KXZ45331.1 hypothetical protein GPECTOR_56g428 [Gonium pectorale]
MEDELEQEAGCESRGADGDSGGGREGRAAGREGRGSEARGSRKAPREAETRAGDGREDGSAHSSGADGEGEGEADAGSDLLASEAAGCGPAAADPECWHEERCAQRTVGRGWASPGAAFDTWRR